MACGEYIRMAFDLLLPRTCIVCGRKLYRHEDFLCLYCHEDFPFTRYWMMGHNPMADRFNAVIQKGLEKAWEEESDRVVSTEDYAHAAALFFFNDEAGYRHIPYQLKYHGNIRVGKYFGNLLGRKLASSQWFADVDMVIPVPLHWRRRWSRGYNQAEIIASQVASVLGVPMRTDILKRVRHTMTQTRLDIADKALNVEGAFRASFSEDVSHILLVDDVFTTGATLGACFRALRSVFPPSVRISVVTLGFVGEV